MKLFISYSRDDKAWVYELWRDLRDRAYHDAWIDQRLIPAQDWWASILQNIETCECCIYVMSPQSVASIYCRAEIDYALALNKPILPLMLKTCEYPPNLRKLHVQYQVIKDDMSLGDVLFITERAMSEVREGLLKGKYQLPQPTPQRPDEPKPEQTSEQILEVFMLAEEAASENNLSLAKSCFQQVIDTDPEGYGPVATQRLNEILNEHIRKSDYERIAHMMNDLALRRGALKLWQVFAQKYGTDYDPNRLASYFPDQAVIPEAKSIIFDQPVVKEVVPSPTPIFHPEIQQLVRQEAKPGKVVELPLLRETVLPAEPRHHTGVNWVWTAMFAVIGVIMVLFVVTAISDPTSPGNTQPPASIYIQPTSSAIPEPRIISFIVLGTADEYDTGIFVKAGQIITIFASVEVSGCKADNLADWCSFYGPDGGYSPMPEENESGPFPLAGAQLVALIGRIGNGDPFFVGTQVTFSADQDGELYFIVNDNRRDDNRGAFDGTVQVE